MGKVTKSGQNNITSPNGNSLALFVDGKDGVMKIKDIRGNIELLSTYITGGGGGGTEPVVITKTDIDILISENALVAGTLYEITGVHPTLYDDGTTSGTTIYLQAMTTNKLASQGYGIFYNPKYNKEISGFGIWDNKSSWVANLTSGVFNANELITANNGATGQLFQTLDWNTFIAISGDWSTATSITGNVTGATADVDDIELESYTIDGKAIWGGYSWTNTTGNVGSSIDVLNLDPTDWSKDVYNETNYNKVLDLIEYDIENDWISRRYEIQSGNDVTFTFSDYNVVGFDNSAISVFMFGNEYDGSVGVGTNNINHGYNENINFQGAYQYNLILNSNSFQINSIFGIGSYQLNLTFNQGSSQTELVFGENSYQVNLMFMQSTLNQTNIIFGTNSYQQDIIFGQNAYQQNITFGQNSYQSSLTFGQSSSQTNITFGTNASQNNLNFGIKSFQSNLTFGEDSNQTNLTFGENSYQESLFFNEGSYQDNLVFSQSSYQEFLTFANNSYQSNLALNQGAYQQNLIFGENSGQYILNFEAWSNQTNISIENNKIIRNVNYAPETTINEVDFSLSTLVYENFPKTIYKRPDGTLMMRYYNNDNVLVFADINE